MCRLWRSQSYGPISFVSPNLVSMHAGGSAPTDSWRRRGIWRIPKLVACRGADVIILKSYWRFSPASTPFPESQSKMRDASAKIERYGHDLTSDQSAIVISPSLRDLNFSDIIIYLYHFSYIIHAKSASCLQGTSRHHWIGLASDLTTLKDPPVRSHECRPRSTLCLL